MEDLTQLLAQLESARTNIAEVTRKLTEQVFELEIQSKQFDFMLKSSGNKRSDDENRILRDKIFLYYNRMVSHELNLVKEDNKLRFENICRNAQMQMEGLLAYFYKQVYRGDVRWFQEDYNQYTIEARQKSGHSFGEIERSAWSKVTFADKYFLFQKFTLDTNLYDFIKLLGNFRNSISHVGYLTGNKTSDVIQFGQRMDVNAVLYALEQVRDYVEYNSDAKTERKQPESSTQLSEQTQSVLRTHNPIPPAAGATREYAGKLHIPLGKEFGFADEVLIPAIFISKNNYESGQYLTGNAKASLNKTKGVNGWVATSAESLTQQLS